MSTSAEGAGRNAGLATVVDTVVAPGDAFARLRIAPTWGWAYLATVLVTAVGVYLSIPAVIHAITVSWPAMIASNPQLAAATPAQQQMALKYGTTFAHFAWTMTPVTVLVGALLQTVILLAFKAIGKGEATFKQLWCLSMNTLLVGMGGYQLLAGIIAVVRGPASYNANSDIVRAIPSLAWLVPHAGAKLVGFLAAFNIMSIWGAVLIAMAMIAVARMSKASAYASAFTVTLLAGAFYGLTAK